MKLSDHFGARRAKQVGLLCAVALGFGSVAPAQVDYSVQIGTPTFTTPSPLEMGFGNLANGNEHLEIPLGSFPSAAGSGSAPSWFMTASFGSSFTTAVRGSGCPRMFPVTGAAGDWSPRRTRAR